MTTVPVTGRPGFRILFVCTGNICRSPFAEILTRHLLESHLGRDAAEFSVSSAGVGAVAGAPMHPASRAELALWGIEGRAADGFVGRQLRPAMVLDVDLVLGMTPWHRSAIVEQVPRALATAFSVREFARLCGVVDQAALPTAPRDRARMLVSQARLSRPIALAPTPDADDVPDPIGLPPAAHRDAAVRIGSAVQTIVEVITYGRRAAPTGH